MNRRVTTTALQWYSDTGHMWGFWYVQSEHGTGTLRPSIHLFPDGQAHIPTLLAQ